MAAEFLLGYDVGSSSIKASLLEADTGQVVGAATVTFSRASYGSSARRLG